MVPVQDSEEAEHDDYCPFDDLLASTTEALGAEDIATSADRFLLEDEKIPVLQMSEDEINAILSVSASPEPPKEKRRLRGL